MGCEAENDERSNLQLWKNKYKYKYQFIEV